MLGRTGIEVPVLGYGTVPIGRDDHPYERAERLLDGLLGAGLDLWDTAAAYDNAEEVIGRFLDGRRERVTLVTKTGKLRGYASAWSRAEIEETVDASLRKLRTDAVDVLLLHSCDLAMLRDGDVVGTMEQLKQAGKTRFIGYSGDNEALAYAVDLSVFDVIEASYSLCDQANRETIARAGSADIGVLVKRPLANAVPGRTTAPASAYAEPYWRRWQALGLRDEDVGGHALAGSGCALRRRRRGGDLDPHGIAQPRSRAGQRRLRGRRAAARRGRRAPRGALRRGGARRHRRGLARTDVIEGAPTGSRA